MPLLLSRAPLQLAVTCGLLRLRMTISHLGSLAADQHEVLTPPSHSKLNIAPCCVHCHGLAFARPCHTRYMPGERAVQ